jgi:hypothetical protein
MTTTQTPDSFTALPDEHVLQATVVALEEHGFSVEVADDLHAAKLVPTVEAAHQRIYQHSLPLEDARAQAAYGQHSQVGKILEIHQELPGRIHIVLIREAVGF